VGKKLNVIFTKQKEAPNTRTMTSNNDQRMTSPPIPLTGRAAYTRKGDTCSACDEVNNGNRKGWKCARVRQHGPMCPWCVSLWKQDGCVEPPVWIERRRLEMSDLIQQSQTGQLPETQSAEMRYLLRWEAAQQMPRPAPTNSAHKNKHVVAKLVDVIERTAPPPLEVVDDPILCCLDPLSHIEEAGLTAAQLAEAVEDAVGPVELLEERNEEATMVILGALRGRGTRRDMSRAGKDGYVWVELWPGEPTVLLRRAKKKNYGTKRVE
jgi:hypothetical protein